MDNVKLLKALEGANVVGREEAAKLEREVLISGKSPEEILYGRDPSLGEKVSEVKSALLNVPYHKVDVARLDDALRELVPEDTVRAYRVVPLGKEKELLVAGMVDPDDLKAQETLKFIARRNKLNLGIYLISYGDLQAALRKYSPYKKEIEAAVKGMHLPQEGGRRLVELEKGEGGTVDAPVIRIVAETLKEAVQRKASDVHIEPQRTYLRVRFRIDGRLQEAASLPPELSQAVVSRIKVLSNLKIDETRIPQDGRFRANIFDRDIDFRVSTFPTPLGEKVAIRVLDPTTGLKTLSGLGLSEANAKILNEALVEPFGMILITGPTGSGKTTTLYAILQILNKEEVNIVSLEDPVEYFVPGVNQSQVQPEIGYDFASGLRQILRQDPDVILVGEIRDTETARLAVHAALTGHVVLSTLHTNNAAGAIPRLVDMKVDAFLLPSTLNLVVGQRLVPLLCGACKRGSEAPPPMQKIIKKALEGLPPSLIGSYREPYMVYRGTGCNVCHGQGIAGRIALFELISLSPKIEEATLNSPTTQRILSLAKEEGMVTLRQDGVLKALQGIVSLEEVLRETEEA